MEAISTIDIDAANRLIRICLSGFFSPDAVIEFFERRNRAIDRVPGLRQRHYTVCDIREMKIQTQETVARFHTYLADPQYPSQRLAFVVGSSLARMQLMRAIGQRSAMVFVHAAEAEAWVLARETTPLRAFDEGGAAGPPLSLA